MFQSNANIQNINCAFTSHMSTILSLTRMLPGFLALVLTQVLCCRLVLNLRAQAQSSLHSGATAGTTKGPTIPAFARPQDTTGMLTANTVNIPLERFNTVADSDDTSYNDHGGVKVHVSVERDVESGR